MSDAVEERFRRIFCRVHAAHLACERDEWLNEPCRDTDGGLADRPIVWSRRNGPWQHVDLLWIGAAPGNAGGRGSGRRGAHGTRIPFGGDIAGANLEALMGGVGVSRNDTFIVAALNELPRRGGGEPRPDEILSPVGDYQDSLAVLRDTVLACAPKAMIALGNVALRAVAGALGVGARRLPGLASLRNAGFDRNRGADLDGPRRPDPAFLRDWRETAGAPLPALLWTTHPSAQNMSPYAGEHTVFHARMLETRAALRAFVAERLGRTMPAVRPPLPNQGIYALREWRDHIEPKLEEMDRLWRTHAV